MNIVVVNSLDILPCTIDMALRQLRALTDDADLVELACRASVAACEDYTGRIFVQTIFQASFSDWPDDDDSDGINKPSGRFSVPAGITLPRSPLVAINSLKYYPAGGGALVEWPDTNYYSDRASLPGRLVFADGVSFPAVDTSRPDAIQIEFEAGHGTTYPEMPANYLMAMLQLARHLFDNPSAVDAEGKIREMPLSFRHLLRSQKV
jgi:hypothetical protein